MTRLKRILPVVMSVVMLLTMMSACSSKSDEGLQPTSEQSSTASDVQLESSFDGSSGEPTEERPAGEDVRIAALKGPTGLGMAALMKMNQVGMSANRYDFLIENSPDAIPAMVISGSVDIAAMPVNMASVVYNKTEGGVTLLAVNTLGVLHLLTTGEEIASITDLEGKTIYATGQGATPEYTLNYILEKNGVNATVEYKSEHAELATLVAAGQAPIAMLPEPFVTTTVAQSQSTKIALDLTEEWGKVSDGTPLTTGCVVVRNEFLKANPEVVEAFLNEYQASCEMAEQNVDEVAAFAEEFEILPNQQVALQAIPRSNIAYLGGKEMMDAVSDYFQVLYDANPQSVGGAIPNEDFFYQP